MSLDMNSLPDDVEELKRIIIFQNIKLNDQRQKEIEYQEITTPTFKRIRTSGPNREIENPAIRKKDGEMESDRERSRDSF